MCDHFARKLSHTSCSIALIAQFVLLLYNNKMITKASNQDYTKNYNARSLTTYIALNSVNGTKKVFVTCYNK